MCIRDSAKGEWVKDEDNEGKSLKVGVLYKAVKSDSDGYFTAIRPGELADEYVTEVANDAFWVTDNHSYAEKDWIKYDTDGETIFVVVEQTYDKKGNKDKLVIDDGNIDDMFVSVKANGDIVPDEDGYYSYVSVIEEDEEYAELVYIWLTKDELTYSDEDAAVADLGKVTGLDGKTAEQLADLLTDIQDHLDKKVSPKTLKDLKAAVDEIKAAQKALTDAQNNAKAADVYKRQYLIVGHSTLCGHTVRLIWMPAEGNVHPIKHSVARHKALSSASLLSRASEELHCTRPAVILQILFYSAGGGQ